ncbi:MAG: hypothetical protein WDN45_14950 [Caulobacteraceae bacterium]
MVTQYLQGGAISAAQQAFSKSFLNGLVGNVSTQVTPTSPRARRAPPIR